MTNSPLDELKAALQPLVDASLRYPRLAAYVPRVNQALAALEGPAPEPSTRGGNGVESDATLRALAEIEGGKSAARAADDNGLARSTVFRALKRRREAAGQSAQPTPSHSGR
ncbi:hypothetical protein [Ralstonia sp.]|uniref:hypothetical protein n=1 Tax=Ralstonia sp. TaxID=54061 RepID=UPI002579FFCB|nr:hypothetical protein [Ralstonia sp.]MBA4203219.1 hypothetical protein [Ralstonia sp.]